MWPRRTSLKAYRVWTLIDMGKWRNAFEQFLVTWEPGRQESAKAPVPEDKKRQRVAMVAIVAVSAAGCAPTMAEKQPSLTSVPHPPPPVSAEIEGPVELVVPAQAQVVKPPPPSVSYVSPKGDRSGRRYIQSTSSEDTLGLVAENAEAIGASAQIVEDEEGEALVVTYSGDAQDFINCGYILTTVADAEPSRTDATTSEALFEVPASQRGLVIRKERKLRVDARATVRLVSYVGEKRFAVARSTYIVSKVVEAKSDDDEVLGRTVDVISFETGASAKFQIGTECQSTGTLELSLLKDL